MARVSVIRSSKVLGSMHIEKYSISTMSAEKRELRNKFGIQPSKVSRTLQRIDEEAVSKERISSQNIYSFSVEGAGNNSGNNHLLSSHKCKSSASTIGSVVSLAGKRGYSLGLLDGQEAMKKQRINKTIVMEKSVVKHAAKGSKTKLGASAATKLGASTATSCQVKRVSTNNRAYIRAHLGGLREQDRSQANHVEVQQMSKSSCDSSDGVVSSVDDASVRHSPHPAASAAGSSACKEGWEATDSDGQMSLKTLRAAMLKNHFADTILKARETLGMKQRDEAKTRAATAEAATLKSLKTNLKIQREREREVSRLALQKMVKTVEIYESQEIIDEIERLAYRAHFMPLKMLGLVLKADEYEEDDLINDLNGEDLEEGEIVC